MKKVTNELIEDFKKYLIEEEKSKNTIDKYIRDIGALKDWLGDRELTKELVIQYKTYLGDNYAPTSTNSLLSAVNAFFDYLEWYELKVKTIKIQRQIFANKENELTKAEYGRLLKIAKAKKNQRLYLLMQTICACGIRVSELEFITVEALKSGVATIRCKGKLRKVYIPFDLCTMLKAYTKERKIRSGSIFVTRNGTPLDRSNIWSDMKKLCKDARVSPSKVFPHNLRHLFARTYYSAEKDVVRLADILGHSSVDTTRIYTMETGDIHRKQIQKLGLLL